MKKQYLKIPAALVLILAAALLMAGCGTKNTDPETQKVLKISITPDPTPTSAPETVNPDAVVASGGITMVNSYLADESSTAGTDSGNTENTENTEEDTLEADSGNE